MRPWSLFAILFSLAACSPRTVDVVQPGALDKDALDGEWYWRRTVTDVPYGTAATFAGASDALERIRWRIEEDLLLGYRSYPNIEDASDSGLEEEGFFGAPLLVFRVEKHFDIRRSYSRTTGEEGNVIEENTELAWSDREYMRVDWNTNLAPVGFSAAGLQSTVLSYSTGDDDHGSAPTFDDSDGDGVIDHLMLEQQVLLQPDSTPIPGYGEVPICLFFGRAQHECGSSEVSVRSSFMRVGDRAPVQGVAYDDQDMETFGFFLTDRLAYDRAYGLVNTNQQRFLNRHPLWTQTYVADDRGELLCDSDEGVNRCSALPAEVAPVPVEIPLAERTLKPIVYHAGPDFPADLLPVMEQIAIDWNAPLADAVNGMRSWDCSAAGGSNRDCNALVDPDLQAFVFCPNNPSLPNDPALCSTDHTGLLGRPDGIGDPVEVGDLRYSLVHVFDNAQLSSPFGYGPSAADPVGTRVPLSEGTLGLGAGEIVSGTAFVYGHVLDRVSHQVADMVGLLNGTIDPDAFVQGENVVAWVEAVRDGTVDQIVGRTHGAPARWDEPTLAARLSQLDSGFASSIAPALTGVARPTDPAAFQAYMSQIDQAIQQTGTFGAGQAGALAAFDGLLQSPFTDLLVNDESIGALGFDPGVTSAADLGGTSPLDLVDPRRMDELEAGWVLAGEQAVDLDEGAFTDSTLIGLALQYAEQGLTHEQIVADVRAKTFRDVMLHEIGHTLGLRHNFAGSFDAFNFRPEYWALRDDGNMGPRHVDPVTDAERLGGIDAVAYSSIMDYSGARNVGWSGLGHYDEAAIKYAYGDLVEVLTAVPEAPAVDGLPNDIALSYLSAYNTSTSIPQVLLWYNDGSMVQLHYTQYPAIAGDLQARTDVPRSRLAPLLVDSAQGAFSDGLAVVDAGRGVVAGSVAAPYRFCSDGDAIGLTCARFDHGADPYEAQAFLRERYWNDYVFSNFARDRYGYGDAASYVGRMQGRVFSPLRTWERYYTLFHGVFGAQSDPLVADFFAADRGFGGWTAATDEGFRFLAQVIARPEPGPHGLMVRADGTALYAPGVGAADLQRDVPLVAGAYYESEWDFDAGYHWFERQSRIGTYWDRMLALLALTNHTSRGFLGYDTAIDPRGFAIGYQDLYGDELAVLLGRLMADEVGQLGPALTASGEVLYPDPIAMDASWPPPNADLVQPAAYWLVQFNAGLFGKALLSAGYDRSFINRSRIYVEGTGDAPLPLPDQELVSYTDPVSGKTWTAWSFQSDDAVPVELGSSARIVRKALWVAERCETEPLACEELNRISTNLDLQLQLFESFESAVQ